MFNNKITTIVENNKKITLWSLALPLLIQTLLSRLINTIGIVILSGYSEPLLTATSVSNQVINLPFTIIESLITGTVILASVELGRNNKTSAASIFGCGTIVSFVLSVLVGAIVALFAKEFTASMNLIGTTAKLCQDYLFLEALIILPIRILFTTFQKYLICNGYSKIVPISSVTTGCINAGLAYILLYAIKPPSDFVIEGLALKTAFAWSIGLLICIIAFLRTKVPFKLNFNFSTAFNIIKIGLPAGMCFISYNFANTITTSFLGSIGEFAIDAKIYINNIVEYVPLVFWAIASANSVIMGRLRGMGKFDDMKILFKQNLKLAIIINGSLSLLCFIFRLPLLSLFTDTPEVLALSSAILIIDIPLEIARGINHLSEHSLNPNGDVKTTLVTSVISTWLFSVLTCYILCVPMNLGLVGLWIGFLCNESSKAIIYVLRWRSEKWKNTKI